MNKRCFCFGGWVLVCALLAPAAVIGEEWVDYSGYRLVLVDVHSEAELARLEQIAVTILDCHIGVRPLKAVVAPERLVELDRSGMAYQVLDEDIGPETKAHLSRPPLRGTFDNYMTFDEQIAFMNSLVAARPDLCQMIDIGNSLQGRDIWVLHITGTDPDPKPGVFYHGLIHAREWITGPVVLYLADYLVNNYASDPCVADLVNRTHFYLAPCVNPDGYVYTWTTNRLWRKNRRLNAGGCYGVDLNRNWAQGWGGGGSSGDPCSETYRGTSAFSEPETQALRDFISGHPEVTAYLDYHSYSQLLMWPWGYQCTGGPSEPDRTTFTTVGNTMSSRIQAVHGQYYEPGPICETIYQASGSSVDWAYGNQDRWAFTIELRPVSSFPGFELPPEEIIPTSEENLAGIQFLSEWSSAGLILSLPSGTPQYILENTPTTITVTITPGQQTYAAGSGRLYYRFNPGDPFSESTLTAQGGNNYAGTLPGAPCGTTLSYYFSATGSGGYVATAPCLAPTDLYMSQVVDVIPGAQLVYSFPLDSNPGWTVQGQWAFGDPAGLSGDPNTGHTGNNVYGYNLNGDYPDNMAAYNLTSTAIDCSNLTGVTVKFWRWLGVEDARYDHAKFQASNNGTTWTTIWENPSGSGMSMNESSWSQQSYSVAGVADNQATVYLRWVMGTSDGSVVYHGWNIDDVEVWGVVPDTSCQGALLGDVSLNGTVDGGDIGRFTAVLLDPGSASQAEICAADIDGGCGVEWSDLELFVALLLAP